MYRFVSPLFLALAACSAPATGQIAPLDADPHALLCATEPAPEGTAACGSDVVCDQDADCAVYPGNYCQPSSCDLNGCLRGRCTLTKVQGEVCARDGECVSKQCSCSQTDGACVCAPEEGLGSHGFP
ncbi:Hypothetical protein A7982_01573 [Minicystis rosea]|nr:Hypothetical protein A7982_01573 [Minicystis rosea]